MNYNQLKLYEKRIAAAAKESASRHFILPGKGSYGSWPFSKITLYKTFLILKAGLKEFNLKYKDIEHIKKNTKFTFLGAGGEANTLTKAVQIKHHADIPEHVYLVGNKLYEELKDTAKKNKLKIKFVD